MSPDFIGHLQTLRWNIVSVNVYIHNCFAGLALFEGELSEPKRKVKMNIVYSNPSDMRVGLFLIICPFGGKTKNGFACEN
jgi:hypothetical protein